MRPFVVQLTGSSIHRGHDEAVAAAKDAFARTHLIHLPGFLSADLLASVRRLVAAAEFVPRVHTELVPPAMDFTITDVNVRGALTFMLNGPGMFSAVEEITGVGGIEFFDAVVSKMVPGLGVDSWHDDVDGNRLLALSVNLGEEPYDGGWLMVRRKGEALPVQQFQNVVAGDALLLRIDTTLEHRLTDVTGAVARLALVGWFQRRPKYADLAAAAVQRTN